jgi:mycothiol synthase
MNGGREVAGHVTVHGRLPPDVVAEVEALLRAATDADGVQPLSEHVWLHLRHGGEGPDRNLLVVVPGPDGAPEVAGYAHLDPTDPVAGPSAEVVVHPAHRGRGFGRLLVEAALAEAPGHRLRLWAHGDHPAARALAGSLGFSEVRRLEQWRRSLRVPLPAAPLPAGVRVRAFRPGDDDSAWLALNAAAFAHHPEQGGWTARDLHARMAEDWFDPQGFLLAEQDGAGGEPELVGFHWTKVHGGDGHGHGPRHSSDDGHEDGHEDGHALSLVDEVVTRAGRSGLAVTCRFEGDREGVAEPVAHLAFRVVQESLTNALRYAPGAEVRIVISVDDARGLAVRVENDRATRSNAHLTGTGRGLVGLRERVQTLGGQFTAGTTGVGGWAVEARLPHG